MCVSNQVHKSS